MKTATNTTLGPIKPLIRVGIALTLAQQLQALVKPYVEQIAIVGSIRRLRPLVRDVELLYVPRRTVLQYDLEGKPLEYQDECDLFLQGLLRDRMVELRKGENGLTAWGPKNKLTVHVETGIPVDFFATTKDCWWNSLVIRTGGKTTNLRLTAAARAKGYSLEAYGTGFRSLRGKPHVETHSEREVFEFAGLPYLEPSLRP